MAAFPSSGAPAPAGSANHPRWPGSRWLDLNTSSESDNLIPMRTLSATEASRSFAAVLDEVERGETVVVTRGGKRIATIGPASMSNGSAFLALFGQAAADADFAADVLTARELVTLESPEWPDD